jgi:polyisoprenoid-binding protein YceI
MTLRRFATILAFALLPALPAAATVFNQVQPEKSRVGFVFKQMGVAVEGRFPKFSAQLVFDPAKPETGRAQIDIDLASVDAGGAEANEEVKTRNWFHIQQFPKASFVSTGVKALGGNRYEVTGKLSIKGKSKDIVIPASFKPEGAGGVFEGSFSIKRLEFGVGAGPWGDTDTVADEVQVKFRLTVAAAPAAAK